MEIGNKYYEYTAVYLRVYGRIPRSIRAYTQNGWAGIRPYTRGIRPYTGSIRPYTVGIRPYTQGIRPYSKTMALGG